jgi:hypothetical protein
MTLQEAIIDAISSFREQNLTINAAPDCIPKIDLSLWIAMRVKMWMISEQYIKFTVDPDCEFAKESQEGQ